MKTEEITEKMPQIVKESIGQAQKQLTLLEGQARQIWENARGKVKLGTSLEQIKSVEETIKGLREKYETSMNLDGIKKAAENFGTQYRTKAFHSLGIATSKDIHSVEKKIDRLRSDIRKLTRKNNSRSKPSSRSRTYNKTTKSTPRNTRKTKA